MPAKELIYNIDGLWCGGCAEAVENKLFKKLKIKSSIDLATQTIKLSGPTKLRLSEIQSTVKNLGYELSEFYDFQEKKRIEDKISKDMLMTLSALTFSFIWAMALSFVSYFEIMGPLDPSEKKILALFICFFSTPGLVFGGKYIYLSAYRNLKNRNFNIDSLITLSVSGCIALTIINIINGTYETYLDSALMALTIFTLIKIFERNMLKNTLQDVKSIDQQRLKEVKVLDSNGNFIKKRMSQVKFGQIVQFASNEEIVFDGIVSKGFGFVDCSKTNGESFLRKVSSGAQYISGTVVQSGSVNLEVTKPFGQRLIDQSLLKSINKYHQNIITEKNTKLNYIFNFSAPLLFLLSSAAFFISYFIFNSSFELSMLKSISLLLIFCPCVLYLSKPLILLSTIKALRDLGIKVHNPAVFSIFPKIKNIVYDKTGTLTGNNLSIDTTFVSPNFDLSEIFSLAASLEENVVHPIASAFMKKAFDRSLSYPPIDSNYFPGKGVQGKVNGYLYRLGKENWATNMKHTGTDLVLVMNKVIIARFSTKTNSDSLIEKKIVPLKTMGYNLFVITGDSEKNTNTHLKDNLKYFKTVFTEKDVSDKGELVSKIKNDYGRTMFIGDGDNDLEAFNSSDISVTTMNASRFSRSTSDVQSRKIGIDFVSKVIQSSKTLNRRMNQNFLLAIFYNIIILISLFYINFNPGTAVLAMSVSSLLIVLNSIR